jgi:hypothetical protein
MGMLRLIHARTTVGPILITDIDDGLPNKNVHRMQGNPNAYARDGYANNPKQPCYLAYASPVDPAQPGSIDLQETDRVRMSAQRGVIKKLKDAGYLTTVVIPDAGGLAPPHVTSVVLNPGTGVITIVGTHFTSIDPDTTYINLTGDGEVTLASADVLDAGGTFTDTHIVIPSDLLFGVATVTTSCEIDANSLGSNTVVVS